MLWEQYWRFFYPGLLKRPELFSIDGLTFMRDQARRLKSQHFDLSFTVALALMHELDGRASASSAERNGMGMPEESAWRVLGGFRHSSGFNEIYWPERENPEQLLRIGNEETSWQSASDGVPDGYIDLRRITRASFNSVAYALLPIVSRNAHTVQLRFGANKPFKVWLNGDPLLIKNRTRGAQWDSDVIEARLQSGRNWLLVKMVGRMGEMGFYFRATGENGRGDTGIEFITDASA